MTYELDSIEQDYDERYVPTHKPSEDGQLGGIIDHLNPEEVAEYTRLRTLQAKVDEGGIGLTRQKQLGTALVEATIAEARANLAARGRA